jgi:hypothetical protein
MEEAMRRARSCFPKFLRLVAAFSGALLLLACDGPVEPEFGGNSLPPLTDAIPYEALGGGRIVFSRTGPGGEYSGIYVVDIDHPSSWGFDPRDVNPVKDELAPGGFLTWSGPCVSPDGTRIAFQGGLSPFVVNVDGHNMVWLDADFALGSAGIPSWTPDGTQLYFWAGPGISGLGTCPEANLALYAQSPVAHPTDRRTVASISGAVWSRSSVGPTGTVVFSGVLDDCGGGWTEGIYVIEEWVEPRPLIGLPVEQEPDTSTWLSSPVWSPDGTRIAYLARIRVTVEGLVADSLAVMVADEDGNGTTELLRREAGWRQWSGLQIEQSVSWSPDGSRLLFNVPEGDFVSHLYVMNADGSGLRAVTTADGVTDRSPSWSR